MEISLRAITKENYEAVCELEIPDEQQQNLSENVYSLVEAHYHSDTHRPRAIYQGEQLAGFMMWGIFPQESVASEALIFRFMVAYEYQRRGIGRLALIKTIDEIKSLNKVDTVVICYSTSNTVAKDLYTSVGFIERGMSDNDDDMLAYLDVSGK